MPIVSVVIPAFNAERWIAETISSVQAQTLSDIEIIVVVDGATDGTLAISSALAQEDARIIVRETKNGGVARARNTGISIARGEFVAPMDADDLWHPRRLEHHVAALRELGEDYAVAFSPFVAVGEDGYTDGRSRLYAVEGYVFGPHLCANLVGNGSGITVRTSAIRAVGGYSPRLRDAGAQGCEDYLLQARLSYLFKFTCVPVPYIGYRKSEGNMSSNKLPMLHSHVLALDDLEVFAENFPRRTFFLHRSQAVLELALMCLREGKLERAASVCVREFRRNPFILAHAPIFLAGRAWTLVRRLERLFFPVAKPTRVPFASWDPQHAVFTSTSRALRARMDFYSRHEAAVRSSKPYPWQVGPQGDYN